MQPHEKLEWSDAWELIRAATLAASPALAEQIAHLRAHDWRRIPPGERQVIFAAALTNRDIGDPAVRRDLRSRVLAVVGLSEFAREAAPNEVTSEFPFPIEWLSHIGAPDFIPALEKLPGSRAATAHLRKQFPTLSTPHAARFLTMLGYPVINIDAAKTRWLKRYGLLRGSRPPKEELAEASRILHALAEAASVSLRELDLVLGAFTSSPKIAWCATKPRCSACPVGATCQTYDSLKLAGVSESAPLSTNLSNSFLPEDRPREKLATRGAPALTDAELLAILLRSGTREENAVVLASRLLREMESLDRLERASTTELAAIHGIGEVKAITIKAALELARRLERIDPMDGGKISKAADVYDILRRRFLGAKREEFLVLLLSTKNVVTRIVTVSSGTLNQSLVHPREAFTEAIRDSAAAVVFAHNHPSGDPTPSRDDQVITDRLVRAGEIMGVRVLDHVIIGSDGYYSFADEGRLRTGG